MSEFEHMDRVDLIAFAVEMRNQRDLAHKRMHDSISDHDLWKQIRALRQELSLAARQVRKMDEKLDAESIKRAQYGRRNSSLATSNRHLRTKLAKLQAAPFSQHIWVASVH